MLSIPALPLFASASVSLADPAGSNVIVAALSWLQGTMLGTAATSIAIVAVACVGLSMLTGRASVRRGVTVILGCFILFGASSIVASFQSLGGSEISYPPVPIPPAIAAAPAPAPAAPAPAYDPYAGASVPSR
jgi:type IV secretory pathway VirB2 component (pilin)